MRTQPRFFHEAAPGDGGAPPVQPTLEQLMDPNYVPPAAAPAAVEGVNDDGTLQEGYQKDEATGAVTKIVTNAPVEGLNDDGTIQEGYQKNADGTITKVEDGASNDDDIPEDDSEAFFAEVAKITGEEVVVDFGGVDPLTPEGVAIRDKVIRDQAAEAFEAYLKQSDPRAYAYMLHRDAGGDDESFFAQKESVLPDETEFKSDIEAQKAIIKQDLINKGIEPDIADAQVTKYIKDNTLTEKATAAYNARKTAQANQLAEIEKANKAEQDQLNAAINTITTSIAKSINEGAVRFVIPETQKASFNNYVKNNLRYDEGKFYLTREVNPENVKEVLEGQFFEFMKGDLSAIVARQAKTQTTHRLRTTVQKAAATKVKDAGGTGSSDGFVPLGNI